MESIWRDNGKGVSIGFNSKLISKAISRKSKVYGIVIV